MTWRERRARAGVVALDARQDPRDRGVTLRPLRLRRRGHARGGRERRRLEVRPLPPLPDQARALGRRARAQHAGVRRRASRRPPTARATRSSACSLCIEAVIDSLVENPVARAAPAALALRGRGRGARRRRSARRACSACSARSPPASRPASPRARSVPSRCRTPLQSLIGLTVFHFASGDFGEDLVGAPLYSAAEIRRRKEHVIVIHGARAARLTRRGDARWKSS